MNKKFKISYVFLSIFSIIALSSCEIIALFYAEKVNKVLDSGANINVNSGDNRGVEGNILSPNEYEIEYTIDQINDYSVYNVEYTPSVGDVPILVIPIDLSGIYSNTPYKATAVNKEKIRKTFFGETGDSSLYYESVASFYKKSSYDKLNFYGTVTDWYDVRKAGFSKTNKIEDSDDVIELMNSAIEDLNINTSSFDSDKDGYIDAVWLIYNYYDYSTASELGINLSINYWAYTFWDQNEKTPSVSSPVTNAFAWASIDFMDSMGASTLDAHTYIHETGHLLGLSDYYDYGGECSPTGGVDMMDANIIDHNYYSKMLLGWVKPYIVTGDCSITLSTSNDEHNFFIVPYDGLSLKTKNNKTYFNIFDEYMVVEYYSPTNLNKKDSDNPYYTNYQGFTNSGFRVYHADKRAMYIKVEGSRFVGAYYSNQELSTSSGILFFITNTFSGDNAESSTIEQIKSEVTLSNFTYSDKYCELFLIDKSDTYNYSSHYKKGEQYICATNNSLFYSGDMFSLSTYKDQFYNSKFNNGKSFTSNIKFN